MLKNEPGRKNLKNALEKIYKIADKLSEWGDMDYREEAKEIMSLAKEQLKKLKK